MENLVPLGTGNSRLMKSNISSNTTLAQLIQMWNNGTFPYDIGPLNSAGISQQGTPLNKDTLLKDTTAALYGLGSDATPDDVFNKIIELFLYVGNVIVGEYTGTGTAAKIIFPKNPLFVIIGGMASPSTFSTTLDSLAIIPSFLGSQSAGSFDPTGLIVNGYVYFSLTEIVREGLKVYTGGVSGAVNSIRLDGPSEEYKMCENNKKYKYFAILGD